MLKKLTIKNFKSFKNFKTEFGDFNCIVAPNNAGKSNFIEALKFLGLSIVDVKKAIEEFGGFDNIKNIFLEKEKIVFECEFFQSKMTSAGMRNKYIEDVLKGRKDVVSEEYIEIFKDITIHLNLEIFKNGHWRKNYFISGRFGKKNSTLPLKEFNLFSNIFKEEIKKIRTFPFKIEVSYVTDFEIDKKLIKYKNEIIKRELVRIEYAKKKEDLLYALDLEPLIEKNISIFSGNSSLMKLEEHFYLYAFYPETIKTSHKGGRVLRFDGTNIVEVLNFIAKIAPNNFENIANSLIGIVEELNDIKIDKDIIDRNTLLLKEKEKFLPFGIVSDGTINLLAILTAIYEPFSKKMIAFDEIEKHLHLKAIDYVLEVLKSKDFQVIFTTQSAEILNSLNGTDNLIFLYRDYEGFTKGINAKKIPNFNKKVRRYKDISTIIKNEVLGYLGDFDED